MEQNQKFKQAITIVAMANFSYFFVEFFYAKQIGSVSLFADSVDFLEDASVNLLILLALSWSIKARAKLGMVLAAILLAPAVATLWTAWEKFNMPHPPEAMTLSLVGFGALMVNVSCAFLLVRFRHLKGSLTKAAFLSARNDAFANIAIIGAGILTAATSSGWPDLIVGLAIAAMNVDAAHEVWEEARNEHKDA